MGVGSVSSRWLYFEFLCLIMYRRSEKGEGSRPLPCHTTGHAGPHPAVRRVELTVSREVGQAEGGEVSVRQSDFPRLSVREVPRSIGAPGRFAGPLSSASPASEPALCRGCPVSTF